ncbi:MAG: hypothetical protein IIB00_10565 [candidate division Zixibacteria bacterium]|nr:hypothetical protein [candidate division Zixibacteria bacterium]
MITLPAPSQLFPREDNLLHPGLRIVDEVNQIRSAWAQSPPFTLIVPTTNIAEGALVLGETEYNYPTDNGAPIPILTARRFGPGKVICLSAAPVWRMGFQSTETQIAELRLMLFVDGCAQWLTALDDLAPVRISPEREVFSRGEKISFRATAYDQGYKPLKGVTGEIELINKDKSDTAFSTLKEIADGRFRAVFEGVTPGTYTYQGQLRREGAFLKSETGTIEVTPYSLEERRLNPDFSALRGLARETSGKYFHLSEGAEIGEYFSGEKKSLNMAFDIPLRDNWRLLALFVIALGAEWILRKRYHLL